jgi:hypothetical protein
LEELEITIASNVSPAGLWQIARLCKLQKLKVSNSRLSVESMQGILDGCRQIEQLDISGNRGIRSAMAQIGQLHNLRRLDISGTDVDAAGLRAICGMCNKIEYLVVEDTNLEAKSYGVIAGLPNLKLMSIGGTQIDEATLKLIVASCNKLVELRIDWHFRPQWIPMHVHVHSFHFRSYSF